MPVISAPHEFNVDDLYIDLQQVVGRPLYLKCEGFNFAGSIKLKAAAEMIDAAERSGLLTSRTTLVESSSGNLGVALSMIAASRGYRFVCVTDIRCNRVAVRLMESYGAVVHVVTKPGADGGFLGARLEHVRDLCVRDDRNIWLNQYANPGNWGAHYRTTGPEIIKQFPDVEVLFVGAGTTGTLMGCARYFRDEGLPVEVVAVDAVGSVTFGGPIARRLIPGLGTSTRPEIFDRSYVDDVVHVEEPDSIAMCQVLAAHGFLLGGSTGTVLAGALSWLDAHEKSRSGTAVLISPDLGERYLDSIYDDNWLRANYTDDLVAVGSTDERRGA
ncbi:2,3-diaminopropionate biosynthesis protein SbnA [Lentzea sp. NPDC051213]|uniref:2,3-diaminopropionate biosynthesis protein SbnA n=1 Tax=Lentzea sp. NPDC051213 TaxID=3364126 RepID=UPI003795B940